MGLRPFWGFRSSRGVGLDGGVGLAGIFGSAGSVDSDGGVGLDWGIDSTRIVGLDGVVNSVGGAGSAGGFVADGGVRSDQEVKSSRPGESGFLGEFVCLRNPGRENNLCWPGESVWGGNLSQPGGSGWAEAGESTSVDGWKMRTPSPKRAQAQSTDHRRWVCCPATKRSGRRLREGESTNRPQTPILLLKTLD